MLVFENNVTKKQMQIIIYNVFLPGASVTLKDSVEETEFSPHRETYTPTPR